ncbi:phosphoadenosine phosphosulfate reductase family protein [Nocardioides okcheonensis]|uniref:phosphoadenosine phosphosulfate reductase family protein n=1 Tax=Nocardioides okcheonensis TaxID=2894081 RepID=UPI001E5DF432|nr:phosphoadenosine phosphosulfate reductase family protein [Nocardioides okcheonensis]UFN46440.1 phosphoadenosine phosphosulfate reductase family protein [Nocardioides okcheonensis]
MSADRVRHVCGISGGKDSSALAIYLRDRVPDMEYFFCDTGAELPETYEYLNKLEVVLGKPIARLNADKGFDHWFEVYRGTLPSPQMRWCTKLVKIKPLEAWLGDDEAISYVAIRADEKNRKGYVSTKPNISAVFPFVEDDVDHEGVLRILDEAGVGLPAYYEWRTRSGCYFCFYQRKAEWVGLADRHPDLFERAVAIEQKVLKDAGASGDASYQGQAMQGRDYTWSNGETLSELLDRRDEILKKHAEAMARAAKTRRNLPLIDVLSGALDEDDDSDACVVCAI